MPQALTGPVRRCSEKGEACQRRWPSNKREEGKESGGRKGRQAIKACQWRRRILAHLLVTDLPWYRRKKGGCTTGISDNWGKRRIRTKKRRKRLKQHAKPLHEGKGREMLYWMPNPGGGQ